MRFLVGLLFLISIPLAHGEAVVHKVPYIDSTDQPIYSTANWIESDKIVLQGLDKISARVFTTEVFVNQKIHFGSLEIYVRSANRTPPEEKPESVAFLEIFDNKQGQQRQKVFSGWMFSSNPALSALEHPVYDIWIKEVTYVPPAEEAAKAKPEVLEEDEDEDEDEDDDQEEQDDSDNDDDSSDDDEDVVVSEGSDDDADVVIDGKDNNELED